MMIRMIRGLAEADFVELEQLKIQVHALSGATAQQGETSSQETA